MRFRRLFLLVILVCINIIPARCRLTWQEHYFDIRTVLGFEDSQKLSEWARYISSDMIDKCDPFYKELKRRHPGFQCNHRLLFHWGYNALPWNPLLEEKVKEYCRIKQAQSVSDTIALFKSEIRKEQKRRNGLINNKTEILFGFSHGGRDAEFARFFASMAYNVHLIGDYVPGNKNLNGLQKLDDVIGLIVIELRNFDNMRSKNIIKEITTIKSSYVGTQKKADVLLKYLEHNIPQFIKEAQNGSIYRRLKGKGFRFVV